jgi:signal transduction histidine kinase
VAADPQGRITVCNREAQRILCLAAADAEPGRQAAEVLPTPLAEALQQCLTAACGERDAAALLRARTPTELPIRYGTAVFTGAADRPMGGLLVLQDISALRQLEEQVRRSDRLASIGTLAAGMAHEIKNPLVSLKTFVQLLPERYDDPEFRTTFIPLLGAEVGRIDAVVTQLLGFARPVKAQLVPTPVHGALRSSLRLVAQQIKSKGLTLVRHLEAPADEVLGDERLLSQVFVNLLLNAIDATPPGGTLTVVTCPAERPLSAWRVAQGATAWLEVQVSDTGAGIAPDDRLRIFDPFFTTKPNGTGLGLSVAYGIVYDHQGCIDVDSEPGQGACFRVSLPLLARSNP